jgi:hypothetical protein
MLLKVKDRKIAKKTKVVSDDGTLGTYLTFFDQMIKRSRKLEKCKTFLAKNKINDLGVCIPRSCHDSDSGLLALAALGEKAQIE